MLFLRITYLLIFGELIKDAICEPEICKNVSLQRNICGYNGNLCVYPNSSVPDLKSLIECGVERIFLGDGTYNCDDWTGVLLSNLINSNVTLMYNASLNATRCNSILDDCQNFTSFFSQMYCQDSIMPYCDTSNSKCTCKLITFNDEYRNETFSVVRKPLNVIVDCTQRNLTSLPHSYPPDTHMIRLRNNQISDLTNMTVVYELKKIKVLDLSNNHIEEFPVLPSGKEKMYNLNVLFLQNNRIKKFKMEALESYTTDYPNLNVEMYGNPFECNCDTRKFVGLLKWHGKTFHRMDFVRCRFEGKEMFPWSVDFDKCDRHVLYKFSPKDIFIGLAVIANCIAIYILVDVYCAYKDFKSENKENKVPLIHHLYLKL